MIRSPLFSLGVVALLAAPGCGKDCPDGYLRDNDGNCLQVDDDTTLPDYDTPDGDDTGAVGGDDSDSGADDGDSGADDSAADDTGGTSPTDTGESETISDAERDAILDLVEAANDREWPDAGGASSHALPYATNVHMGISQGTDCSGHSGSLEGSIDFTISGNYESANGIVAVASAAGEVVGMRDDITGYVSKSYGNFVLLRHADGTFSHYAHLDYQEVYVTMGQEVCQGETLGLIGNTGESSGEHLHYEQQDSSGAIIHAPVFDELSPVPTGCYPCTTSTHTSGCYESVNDYAECSGDDDCPDIDGDGYTDSDCSGGTDCDDNDSARNPGAAEECDSEDDDCDGDVDEGVLATYYRDSDNDDYGTDETTEACAEPSGYAVVDGDCDDGDANVHPGASEQCNEEDDDCDSTVDEGVTYQYWYPDDDSDGYGDASGGDYTCEAPSGHVGNDEDCDDSDGAVNPGEADDPCDTIDNDCSGSSATPDYEDSLECDGGDVWWYDSCGEPYTEELSCTEGCASGDCQDYAAETTSVGSCREGDYDDILEPTSVSSVYDPTGAPYVTVTWAKCDGSGFNDPHTCRIYVGAVGGSVRDLSDGTTSFTWEEDEPSYITTFPLWPDDSPFSADDCDVVKEFYIGCDEGSEVAYRHSGSYPISFQKYCE